MSRTIKLYKKWQVKPLEQEEKGYDLQTGMEELKEYPSMAEDWQKLFENRVSFKSAEFILIDNKYTKIIVDNASANIADVKFNVDV